MKAGDIVQIVARHNPQYHTPAPGDRGFIEELLTLETGDEWANVVLLREDGSVIAVGGHPVRLLAPEDDPLWLEAKRLHDARIAAHAEAMEARTASWHAHVSKVATEFDLSPEKVEAIHESLQEWEGFIYG